MKNYLINQDKLIFIKSILLSVLIYSHYLFFNFEIFKSEYTLRISYIFIPILLFYIKILNLKIKPIYIIFFGAYVLSIGLINNYELNQYIKTIYTFLIFLFIIYVFNSSFNTSKTVNFLFLIISRSNLFLIFLIILTKLIIFIFDKNLLSIIYKFTEPAYLSIILSLSLPIYVKNKQIFLLSLNIIAILLLNSLTGYLIIFLLIAFSINKKILLSSMIILFLISIVFKNNIINLSERIGYSNLNKFIETIYFNNYELHHLNLTTFAYLKAAKVSLNTLYTNPLGAGVGNFIIAHDKFKKKYYEDLIKTKNCEKCNLDSFSEENLKICYACDFGKNYYFFEKSSFFDLNNKDGATIIFRLIAELGIILLPILYIFFSKYRLSLKLSLKSNPFLFFFLVSVLKGASYFNPILLFALTILTKKYQEK